MASRINQNWVFGQHAGLDFSTSPPTPSGGTLIDTMEGCACISDAGGALVLCTDGRTVWDGGGTVRATALEGHTSSTQSAIIVPDPGSPARYYVFTADGASGTNKHVNGVRIDTTTWAVTPLSALMTLPVTAGLSATERVTAVQHANCRDVWVLTVLQRAEPNAYRGMGVVRVFLVTQAGVQHVADTQLRTTVQDLGYLKASGDGRRIAIANWADANVLVYPFDNASGAVDVAGGTVIPVPAVPVPNHARQVYGVEFSPSGRLLYYSVLGDGAGTGPVTDGYVFQHDLSAAGPSVLVGTHRNVNERYALGALQRGMDGRIYIAQDSESALGVIATPDVAGAGCGLAFDAVALPRGATCLMGLPNLIPNPCGCACEEGNCDAAVDAANRTLDERADRKHFTLYATGQRPPRECQPAFKPADFAPVFTLHWGEGASDRFESHDHEIVYLRVRNPYRNLLYRGVKVYDIRVTPNQALPDGEPALRLVPEEIVCFDALEPCAHVTRDLAFFIQNAIPQAYRITFSYCIEETVIVSPGRGGASFDIDVVAS